MTLDDALGWISLALILLTMAVSLWALATYPRGPRIRCPGSPEEPGSPEAAGASLAFRALLDPRRVFFRGTCWYDLTGLPPVERHAVRCPECGRVIRANRMRADGRRLRLEFIALLLLLASMASFAGPWIRGGCWTRSIPTLALAALEHTNQLGENRQLRCEINDRVYGGEVTGLSASLMARALVQDLRDDSTKWNAHRAMDLLDQLGSEADAALTHALTGGDNQARVLSARLLRDRQFPPSEQLLWACVEDLRDDAGEVNWYLSSNNAQAAAEYLTMHAVASRDLLDRAMRTGDRQQRLLAAAIAAHAGLMSLLDLAAPILVAHLRDNHVMGDAKVAAPAIFRFGRAALPHLYPHIDSADKQLRLSARSIIERIENPQRSIHRLKNPMPRISDSVGDPLQELTIGESVRDLNWR